MFALEDVSIVTAHESFAHLTSQHVVFLDGSSGPLTPTQEATLCTFVENGGGLVCSGNAVEMYHEYELLSAVLGNVYGMCTPQSEIIVRVATPDSYLTRRVDPSFVVFEAVYLLVNIPSDAEALWNTTWHYTPYTVAYTRSYGRGRVFCTTLGSTQETQAHPVFQQMLARALHYTVGVDTTEKPARVAMIGYGAIGFEHGTAISNVVGLEYALVCDRNEERLSTAQMAFPGVRTCTDLREVAEDPTIDVVIVLDTTQYSCNHYHANVTCRKARCKRKTILFDYC